MEFSLKLAEEAVTLDGAAYTLRELDGRGRERYAGMQLAAADDSVDGLLCGLVALSLYDADGKPVPRQVVDAWPGRVVDALAKRAQELSGLRSEGNDPAASGADGSDSP